MEYWCITHSPIPENLPAKPIRAECYGSRPIIPEVGGQVLGVCEFETPIPPKVALEYGLFPKLSH